LLRTMSDASVPAKAPVAADEAAAPGRADALLDSPAPAVRRRRWRHWASAALFGLVALCFVLPFASTSCTAPGGYGRGPQGTSTVYRGVDLALDAVPAVSPGDRAPRPGSLPNDGRIGVQVLALLALLAALGGIALGWAGGAPAYAALVVGLLLAAQLAAVSEIAGRIGDQAALPSGKSQGDYVGTGQGFVLALLLLATILAVNGAAALWQTRRARHRVGPELTAAG
jgi:hypothetical protein